MTAATWTTQLIQTTDAEFRAWGSAVGIELAAIGLVQTADTGQINWTTVLKPAGATTSQGYEIWRMNDASQSTCPIYLKLEYGSGTAAANPSMWITVGTSSNGSGTITGTPILARSQLANSSGADAAGRVNYGCAQAGIFWIGYNVISAAGIGFSFGFARFCDANGVANTDGGLFWYSGMTSPTVTTASYYRPSGTVRTAALPFPVPVFSASSSAVYGGNVAVFEPVIWSDRPSRVYGILGVYKADFAAGTSFSMTAFGSTRTLLPITGANGPRATDYASTILVGMLAVYS